MTNNVGAKLRDIREFQGLTVREAAKKIKIHYAQLSRYENGTNEPGVDTIMTIAKGYQISPREELELFFSAKMIHPAITKFLLGNTNECRRLLKKAGVIIK